MCIRDSKEGAQPVKWTGEGDTEYTLENTEKAERGTDIIMYINAEEKDFLEENKLQDLLTKHCKFLPIEIVFTAHYFRYIHGCK